MQKGLVCFIAALMAGTAVARAADDKAYISLFDGMPEAENESSDKAAAKAGSASEKDDGFNIFSFLNFKSTPKKSEVKQVPGQQLSPLQQTILQAEKGDVNAQLSLGYSYLYGENGAEVNYDKAFEYYAQAAMQNDNVGLNNLGSLYYSGIGIPRNTAKAAILFEKAAKLGNTEAAVNLGFILLTGNGVVKNPGQAMQLFEQAAEKKNPTAEFMTGYAKYTGKLLQRDYNAAAIMMRDAAKAGYDDAQYVLSLMYINGQGFPQNYGNGVKYLKEAVAQGHIQAMMTLGDILARGEKYTQDIYTAHVMFNLAAVRGAAGAAEKRNALESKMKIDEVLQAQSEAERFKEKPSELTNYIHQTFGASIRSYVDNAGN